MEIIRNNKGGEKVCLNGFMYTLNCVRKSKLWWKCVERKRFKCRSSISTDLGKDNPEMGQPHCHPPDEAKIRVAKVRNFMRERAKNSEDNPIQIYSDGVSLLGEETLLPSSDVCKRTIRRHRSSIVSVQSPESKQKHRSPSQTHPSSSSSCSITKQRGKTKHNSVVSFKDLENDLIPFEFNTSTNHTDDLEAGSTKTENASATLPFEDDSPTALSQPTAAKILKKIGNQFEDYYFENEEQKSVVHSVQSCLSEPDEIQMKSHPQLVAPLPTTTQPVTKEKQIFIVADHQHCVMSSLASLWKSGKLCDAGIGNGSSTVMVHKLVLSAICPKLFSVFNTDIKSQEFLQVNFPKEVSEGALNAFAEYMYNGILDLDPEILEQMKIIAKRLDMTEFEQLCDSHLSNHLHQTSSVPFNNVPSIQTMQIPAMTSSSSFDSTNFTQSTNPIIDNQQNISMDEEIQKKPSTAAVFSQQSLAPNKSEDSVGFVPSVKIEPLGPEEDQCNQWNRNCNEDLKSTTISSLSSSSSITNAASSSLTSLPASSSSTEFTIPSSQTTDFKSTRLKRKYSSKTPQSNETPPPHLVSNSSPVKNMGFPSDSMNKNYSKSLGLPSNIVTSTDLPTRNNTVYPVNLVPANGNNLPLTTETADIMTVNSFMTSEKT